MELLIESEGMFDEDLEINEDPITSTRAPSNNNHPIEFTWKPRGERKSSSSSSTPSPKSPKSKTSLLTDKRYSFNRKTPATSLVRRASFNEKSLRSSITTEENQRRLSRILPPWCQQPPQPSISTISETSNGTDIVAARTNGKEADTSKEETTEKSVKTASTPVSYTHLTLPTIYSV